MALNLPTILDIAKSDAGAPYELINEAITLRPEFELVPAATMDGDSLQLTVLKGLPTVGFRLLNEGHKPGKPNFETRLFQTANIAEPIGVDKQLLERAKNAGKFLTNWSAPFMEAVVKHLCRQFYYGVGNDAKGFPGLIAQYDAANFLVDATGTAAKSSIWFLSLGRMKLEWMFGNGQTIVMDPQWKEETLFDDANGEYPGLKNWIKSRPAVRLANKQAAVRIGNIGTATNKTATYTHMYTALGKMRTAGMEPTVILMSPRSQEQLRQTLITSDVPNPPLPKEFEGIPIKPTSMISDDE